MKPALTLAETTTSNGVPLSLVEHDGEYSLHSDGVQLESSFAHNAATQLGLLSAQPFRGARQPRLLLSGLGLGYTLAALRGALLQKKAVFQVAEPIACLPAWHREHLPGLHQGQLDDPRVVIRREGLADALHKAREEFQAMLLDADACIPEAGVATREGIPHASFLHRAHSSLKEGGLLAICCQAGPGSFERKLRQAGFDVSHELVAASHKGKQKQRSTIWLARKGAYQERRPSRRTEKKKFNS